jgi:hypothetical protein
MNHKERTVNVYVEDGEKKVFAGAVDWPGWCRSGKNEEEALQALRDTVERYGKVLRAEKISFDSAAEPFIYEVTEKLRGDAATEFGTPGKIPVADSRPLDEAELERLVQILDACWAALQKTARAAAGKELRKGPRGGGRDLDAILRHVLDANNSYLSSMGWKKQDEPVDLPDRIRHAREGILTAVKASARGELGAVGPRGGVRWPARYYIRRAAWHILDHAWEIEDRVQS